MRNPLTNVLLKIFADGFYKAHLGLFLFFFFIFFGICAPGQLLNFHLALMLTFITSPIGMVLFFMVLFLYTLKGCLYVSGQIFALHQQFLFYSSNAFSEIRQFKSWAIVQTVINLPILIYGAVSVGMAVRSHHLLPAFAISGFLLFLPAISALFYIFLINRLSDGNRKMLISRFTKSWQKPYFSIYVYHVLDHLKTRYILIKVLSYLIITGVFMLFADAAHDYRVAGIAVLSIAVAHSGLIFEGWQFENIFMAFSRNLPISRLHLFISFLKTYFFILLPEEIWLFTRFNPLMALGLTAFTLTVVLLLVSLLYLLKSDMEKYLTRVFGLFILLFWAILFKLLWPLIILGLLVAYLIFYSNYYKA